MIDKLRENFCCRERELVREGSEKGAELSRASSFVIV